MLSKNKYLPYIDGLRAIAVISVIIYHLNPSWLRGGFSGVDVFFVISGYVVSASLADKESKSFFNFISYFYSRRMLRIIPALIFCLLITCLASALFIPEAWLSNVNHITARYAFFGASNYALIFNDNDYFSPKSDFNPFTHTWSLGVEEQFYLIFPIVFYFWTLSSSKKTMKSRPGIIFISMTLLSFAYSSFVIQQSKTFAFYSLQTRFWELGAGILLFMGTRSNKGQLKTSFLKIVEFISLLMIVFGFIFLNSIFFPIPGAIPVVLGTMGLLWTLNLNEKSYIKKFLSSKYLVFVGKISYSLYIWHWPIIVLFRWTVGLNHPLKYLAAIVIVALCSLFSYFCIETPIRHSSYFKTLPHKLVAVSGVITLILSGLLGQYILSHQSEISLSVTSQSRLWYPDLKEIKRDDFGCHVEHLSQPHGNGKLITFKKKGCGRPTKLFVIGDSHASAYLPMLQELNQKNRFDVVIYTGAGCKFLDLLKPTRSSPDHCRQFGKDALDSVLSNSLEGDVLFLPSLRVERFSDQWSLVIKKHKISDNMRIDPALMFEAKEEAKLLLRSLIYKKVNIVFDAPKPIFFSAPFRCSDWFNKMNTNCTEGLSIPKKFIIKYRSPVMKSLAQLSSSSKYVHVWDPLQDLCPDQVCYALKDNKPLFFDGDHLSGYGNQLLYGSFSTFLTKLKLER